MAACCPQRSWLVRVIPTFQACTRSSGLAPAPSVGAAAPRHLLNPRRKGMLVGAAHWAVTDPAVLDNVNVRT